MIYWNGLLEKLMNAEEVVIYGAGTMGKAVKRCLEGAPYHIRVKTFLVGSLAGNPEQIDGIPVIDIVHGTVYRNLLVVAALHEKYMDGALRQLAEAGFCQVEPLAFDSDTWSEIRGNRFWSLSGETSDLFLDEVLRNDLHVYVVRNIADREVKEPSPERSFEIPIQAGAALTKTRIAPVTDHTGDNISEKNKKYCELTALYWIWKHDRAKYVGLSHYRRRFALSDQAVMRLPETDIDVVVTVPVFNPNGVKWQYCRDHVMSDWDVMMRTIAELFPRYLDAAKKVETGNFYYGYNMLIARREIFDRYCEWLFPILSQCERCIGDREDVYQGRYIGFLAERLMTIFLTHHKKEFKSVIARKHFIESE